jgi:hypothetical protein
LDQQHRAGKIAEDSSAGAIDELEKCVDSQIFAQVLVNSMTPAY